MEDVKKYHKSHGRLAFSASLLQVILSAVYLFLPLYIASVAQLTPILNEISAQGVEIDANL